MEQPIIQVSDLKPLDNLRLRRHSAYQGTVTEPGALVSDGKIIFALDEVVGEAKTLAEGMRKKQRTGAVVPQERAEQVFQALARRATKKARVLGQFEKPVLLRTADTDNVAVLCYGRGRRAGYVCVNAHRLLLLQKMTEADEILCSGPQEPVLLRRNGTPVAGLTALCLEPKVEV